MRRITLNDISAALQPQLPGVPARKPKKPKRLPRINVGEESFLFQVKLLQLPEPARNFRFHPVRKWEIDFAWPELRMGIEIQGGVWSGGKHGRGSGIVKDMEKHNALLDLRWRVWMYTPGEVTRGEALQHIAPLVRSASSALLKRSNDARS